MEPRSQRGAGRGYCPVQFVHLFGTHMFPSGSTSLATNAWERAGLALERKTQRNTVPKMLVLMVSPCHRCKLLVDKSANLLIPCVAWAAIYVVSNLASKSWKSLFRRFEHNGVFSEPSATNHRESHKTEINEKRRSQWIASSTPFWGVFRS